MWKKKIPKFPKPETFSLACFGFSLESHLGQLGALEWVYAD